jgi:hypothetical protein
MHGFSISVLKITPNDTLLGLFDFAVGKNMGWANVFAAEQPPLFHAFRMRLAERHPHERSEIAIKAPKDTCLRLIAVLEEIAKWMIKHEDEFTQLDKETGIVL